MLGKGHSESDDDLMIDPSVFRWEEQVSYLVTLLED